jgi:hypothetical protein
MPCPVKRAGTLLILICRVSGVLAALLFCRRSGTVFQRSLPLLAQPSYEGWNKSLAPTTSGNGLDLGGGGRNPRSLRVKFFFANYCQLLPTIANFLPA